MDCIRCRLLLSLVALGGLCCCRSLDREIGLRSRYAEALAKFLSKTLSHCRVSVEINQKKSHNETSLMRVQPFAIFCVRLAWPLPALLDSKMSALCVKKGSQPLYLASRHEPGRASTSSLRFQHMQYLDRCEPAACFDSSPHPPSSFTLKASLFLPPFLTNISPLHQPFIFHYHNT